MLAILMIDSNDRSDSMRFDVPKSRTIGTFTAAFAFATNLGSLTNTEISRCYLHRVFYNIVKYILGFI